jgi:glycerol-3-phosphate acyltransferase PlsY
MLAELLCVVLSYLIGAVPFGYLVARLRGVDIFKAGSGNIGATNVGRVLGRKFGVLVFVLDFLKGAVPVAAVRHFLPDLPCAAVAAGLATFTGHMFPIYLNFRGGKGVATGTGVVAMLMPGATAMALAVWISVLAATRYVSLASILAAFALAAVRLMTTSAPFSKDERILTGFSLLAAILVTARHRTNFGRLIRGEENRISDSPKLRMLGRVLHVLALSLWFGGGVMFTFIVTPSLFRTFEGTLEFGIAVGPLFPLYFALQGACGIVALVTAWGWTRSHPDRIQRVRLAVIAVAVAILLAAWPVVGKVEALRFARNAGEEAARAAFGLWHGVSLLLNFGVLALVGAAVALTARLPVEAPAVADPQAG